MHLSTLLIIALLVAATAPCSAQNTPVSDVPIPSVTARMTGESRLRFVPACYDMFQTEGPAAVEQALEFSLGMMAELGCNASCFVRLAAVLQARWPARYAQLGAIAACLRDNAVSPYTPALSSSSADELAAMAYGYEILTASRYTPGLKRASPTPESARELLGVGAHCTGVVVCPPHGPAYHARSFDWAYSNNLWAVTRRVNYVHGQSRLERVGLEALPGFMGAITSAGNGVVAQVNSRLFSDKDLQGMLAAIEADAGSGALGIPSAPIGYMLDAVLESSSASTLNQAVAVLESMSHVAAVYIVLSGPSGGAVVYGGVPAVATRRLACPHADHDDPWYLVHTNWDDDATALAYYDTRNARIEGVLDALGRDAFAVTDDAVASLWTVLSMREDCGSVPGYCLMGVLSTNSTVCESTTDFSAVLQATAPYVLKARTRRVAVWV